MDTALLATVTAALGTLVTALATIALWRATGVLAKETSRMADATGQPQIVATIRGNKWTMMYADLVVTNSGNASAFSIQIAFEPALEIQSDDGSKEREVPFQNITIMRPGEIFSSDIGKAFPMLEKNYRVTTSWLRHPDAENRESLSYDLSFGDFKGVRRIGAGDPLVQIADEVKHIRDDWRQITSGNRSIKTDVFTTLDRLRTQRDHERQRRALQREAEAEKATQTPEAPQPSSDDSPES